MLRKKGRSPSRLRPFETALGSQETFVGMNKQAMIWKETPLSMKSSNLGISNYRQKTAPFRVSRLPHHEWHLQVKYEATVNHPILFSLPRYE